MALSYAAVTVGALLLVELLLIALGLVAANVVLHSTLLPETLGQELNADLLPLVEPHLGPDGGDAAALEQALAEFVHGTTRSAEAGEGPEILFGGTEAESLFFVVDVHREVVAAVSALGSPEALAMSNALAAGSAAPLVDAAFSGGSLVARSTYVDGQVVFTTPVTDADSGQVVGAIGISLFIPLFSAEILRDLLPLVGVSLLVFTVGAGIVGTAFGFITSRGLVKRLQHLSNTADAWSQGDLTTFIEDRSGDEISHLAYRMNRMAEQLQNLLESRNRLAVLEERNRLARDLHDSVKQQAFAASAQISAARALLERDPAGAAKHLAEAEELTYGLRQELANLIDELRPAALQEQGLAAAVRDYAEAWARRQQVACDVRVSGERAIPLATEQALLRIVQEALSNVARHSGAAQVSITLAYGADRLTLTISDNGRGYATGQARTGFGLQSMRERAQALPAGEIAFSSAPGRGTEVTVRCSTAEPG